MKGTWRQFVDRGAELKGIIAAFVLALVLSAAWLVTGSLLPLSDGWEIVTSTVMQIAIVLVLFVLFFQICNAPPEVEERLDEEAAPYPY